MRPKINPYEEGHGNKSKWGINISLQRARSRRVQAQRKFAQGAYVPPNVASAAAATVDRRDPNQDARNVVFNRVSASNLLDVVSLQGVHHHLQPVVLLERMRGRNINRDHDRDRDRDAIHVSEKESEHHREKDILLTNKIPKVSGKQKKSFKRLHIMSLRSRRHSKAIEFKKMEIANRPSTRQAADKRKPLIQPQKRSRAKKKCYTCVNSPVESSEFSLDDNRPLTYFAKCSTPKRPTAPTTSPPVATATKPPLIPYLVPRMETNITTINTHIQPLVNPGVQPSEPPAPTEEFHNIPIVLPRIASPEPVPGPSGLQKQIIYNSPIPSTCSSSKMPSLYYSEHNIHRWMNDSLTSDSLKTDDLAEVETTTYEYKIDEEFEPAPTCPASRWRSVKDVIDAPKDDLDSRCNSCPPCVRISKLIKLSSLLKTQVQFDITGDNPTEEDTMVSPDGDNRHIYLELLPKHPGLMIKLRSRIVHGKELLSACLIPRSDASNHSKDVLLHEQEQILDQLNETHLLSLRQDKPLDRTSIDSYHSEESDLVTCDRVKVARIREMEAKRRVRTRKLMEAEARMKAVEEAEARFKAEIEAAEAAKARIQIEEEAAAAALMRDEDTSYMDEVDAQARELEKEKDAKVCSAVDVENSSDGEPAPVDTTKFPERCETARIVDAPIYRPTFEEFEDPIQYIESIREEAEKYGICKIIPPEGWKPESKIPNDLRFDVVNQYISRLYSRWGPAAREMCAIKLCLQQQNVNFVRPPLVDGIEVNLPKLYLLVQRHGGLENVINKKRWGKVAEEMKFSKTPSIERRLDQIYVKYLLPYATLQHHERQEIMRKVETAWCRKNQKLLDRALNPLHRQKRMLGESESSGSETDDDGTGNALVEAEDCVVPGSYMNIGKFKKVASLIYANHFGERVAAGSPPTVKEIEDEYWRHVLLGTEHLCVNTASVDTGPEGHGFTKKHNEPYGRHPWNLKMFAKNHRNMLRYLGPVLGVTVPTLHLCMLYSTSCWHKDPHLVAWTEYMHVGSGKIWYGIPNSQADLFRKAVEILSPTSCQNKKLWLPSDITMIPPAILRDHNVSLSRAVQDANEFIVVFSNSYSCSISTGYSESESVYFAPPSWLQNLSKIFQEARESCEPTMFSLEQLLLSMSQDPRVEPEFLKVIQPILKKMIHDEIKNRRSLQNKGIKFVYEKSTNARRKGPVTMRNERELEECEYCRTSLYLSKVSGLLGKKSTLCLEHALRLLESDRFKDFNTTQVEVYVYVTAKELNHIADGVKSRLDAAAS